MADKNYYKSVGTIHNSIIANVDILGYTQFIESAVNDDDANVKLWSLQKAIYNSHYHVTDKHADLLDFRGWEVKAYTDNISICLPIISGKVGEHESSIGALSLMLFMLCKFQLEMLSSGSFFIRGAVSFGKVYSDDSIVYGKGLIDAHKVESKRAVYPRIILCDNARQLVDGHKKYVHEKAVDDILPELIKDNDGEYFIDYLKILGNKDCDLPEVDFVEKHRHLISERMVTSRSDSTILRKYLWAANYHNFHCSRRGFEDKLIEVPSLLEIV